MKHFILAAIAGLSLAATAAQADPAEGIWQTEVDDGAYAHVQLAPCGGAVCGTIVRTFNASGEYNSPNKGKQIVRSMAPQGGGAYEGQVWRPSNNKIYLGKMTLAGERLQLKGCIAGGLLCSSQTWARVQ
ncbi:DUF2147 domain-containing protein [Maribius pontilimi]|uniref:DUF2147 domain-containing protein n=1 Tax=Palleronia pontilimi TaxID=1964209 RepID=A0A934MD15_9RHOB|nr:DUF2147 domain-containing protein [Palleronia pontilimi]MBJ3763080.1 DUF2147 domain-containing protein [Palleronia pontilimi]